jgi:hypothetical protein
MMRSFVLVMMCAGCATTARLHVGMVVDDRAKTLEVGVTGGFGLSDHEKHSALLETVAAAYVDGHAVFELGFDDIRLPERGAGWRWGVAYRPHTHKLWPCDLGARIAALFPMRDREGDRDRSVTALGLEAMYARVLLPDDADGWFGRFSLTLERFKLRSAY